MEAGAASELLALADYGGVELAPEQRLLTPFQRMVVLLEAQRQQEEMEADLGNQVPNSAHQPGGGSMKGDTVTYVNENT